MLTLKSKSNAAIRVAFLLFLVNFAAATAQISYTIDPPAGQHTTGGNIIEMAAELNGTEITFTVFRADGTAFRQDGVMTIRAGAYFGCVANYDTYFWPYSAGQESTSKTFDLQDYFTVGRKDLFAAIGRPAYCDINDVPAYYSGKLVLEAENSIVSSILFRELRESDSWGWGGIGSDTIPGFDHVGLHYNNVVYESHPGYCDENGMCGGIFYSEDGNETVDIANIFGVQFQHTRATFEHDRKTPGEENSEVIDFDEIEIDATLAMSMAELVQGQSGSPFNRIGFSSKSAIEATLSPEQQKGGNGSYTCVGLVEWAAEQAGHREGEGFIPDDLESVTFPDFKDDEGNHVFPPIMRTIGLLSPQLLHKTLAFRGSVQAAQEAFHEAREYMQGFFDPVDFIITDPLGRQLGYSAGAGELGGIPNAFFSGDGLYEQFLVLHPVPGVFSIRLIGTDKRAFGGVGTSTSSIGFDENLAVGEEIFLFIRVESYPGAPGDITQDGVVDDNDQNALMDLLGNPAEINDPADINGDGLIDEADIALFQEILNLQDIELRLIDIKPGSDVNPINPRSQGKIPVAILSSATFNAPAEIDRESPTFGRTGNEDSMHRRGGPNDVPNCGEEDVNEDGFIDLVCHFFTQIAGFQEGDTKGFLKGQTTSGELFEAMDGINIVPPGHDSDNDGIEDDIEEDGPNNGDANNDGFFDAFQLNVTTLRSAVSGSDFITLETSPGCINTDVRPVNPGMAAPDPSGLVAPQGLIAFILESCSFSDTTIFFHGETSLAGSEYRRLGPTPDDRSTHWYSFPNASFGTQVIDGATVATAYFQLQDGELGDDDLTIDGRIVDPGGPARNPAATTDIPTLNGIGLGVLVLLLLGTGVLMVTRRRRMDV